MSSTMSSTNKTLLHFLAVFKRNYLPIVNSKIRWVISQQLCIFNITPVLYIPIKDSTIRLLQKHSRQKTWTEELLR